MKGREVSLLTMGDATWSTPGFYSEHPRQASVNLKKERIAQRGFFLLSASQQNVYKIGNTTKFILNILYISWEFDRLAVNLLGCGLYFIF